MNRQRTLLACMSVCALLSANAGRAHADPINSSGQKLAKFLDSLDVEHKWLAHEHVNWETGEPDGKPSSDAEHATHCSAFVASAAKQLSVYILRPPEHTTKLLANAQYKWLADKGADQEWKPSDAWGAQQAANQGNLAVAVFCNPNDEKPGHVAIVRPDEKPQDQLKIEGPQIIQAGMTNYASTTVKEGFKHHPGAWGDDPKVRFFVHALKWDDGK
jgi:hypothetical protein